jgi:hypothetical protein
VSHPNRRVTALSPEIEAKIRYPHASSHRVDRPDLRTSQIRLLRTSFATLEPATRQEV